MKILVLNGSPKGDLSVTLQYVHFIQKAFQHHELKIVNVAQQIARIEKDESAFQGIVEEVRSSDGILWAFPLYFFLVPSQHKRFIELISERGVEKAFRNKYAAVLTTSIHFYDHAAHNYMRAVCDDLDMNFAGSFSPDMYDLLKEEERERLVLFAADVFGTIEKRLPTAKSFSPLTRNSHAYVPGAVSGTVEVKDRKVLILTDLEEGQTNLSMMIERARRAFSRDVETINLRDLDVQGGCLGCLRCSYDNTCVYRDDYARFFTETLQTADVLVFAGQIKDRYLSSKWKQFFDRSFFRNHVPSLKGKQIAFLISGPLRQIPNLREVLEAHIEIQRGNLVDIVTDEYEDSRTIDALIQGLAVRLIGFSETRYEKPRTFLGIGGGKILRDNVWGRLRFPFLADHKFFKERGLYDFPQKEYRRRITNAVLISLARIPRFREEIYTKRMKEEMVKPLKRVVDQSGGR